MSASTTLQGGLACALLVACVGCAASETGNPITGPVAERSITLLARSTDETVSVDAMGSDASGLSVSQAWIVLGDLRFETGARCDDGDEQEADIEGPIVVDLVQRPDPLEVAIESTTYCRVRVPLDRAENVPSGAPPELEDAAIVLLGARADGQQFVVRSRREQEAEIRSEGQPFELTRATASLILAFDVGRWLEGLDLEAAEPGSDGVIRIDDDDDSDRLDRFESNVETAMELFRDTDDDGTLDDDEADAPLATSE